MLVHRWKHIIHATHMQLELERITHVQSHTHGGKQVHGQAVEPHPEDGFVQATDHQTR